MLNFLKCKECTRYSQSVNMEILRGKCIGCVTEDVPKDLADKILSAYLELLGKENEETTR